MPPNAAKKIQPPKGTRDFYPEDLLKKRYIEHCWRAVSLRHGFEEIDGPTFETAELYRVKSGEGILNEMFGVYSGKSPEDVESVKRGEPPFALRPEFTPTLARMYAARAAQLPKPTKWFCVPNFFRAERPQRGRLREFGQWNADVVGGEESDGDSDILLCMIDLLEMCGLSSKGISIDVNHRRALASALPEYGIAAEREEAALRLLDASAKLGREKFADESASLGVPANKLTAWLEFVFTAGGSAGPSGAAAADANGSLAHLINSLKAVDASQWMRYRPSLARGLAYYTGTVFEVIAEGERAVAGGGRYDNLIELFGGPPTPACGFGMGDVVLANLLHDKGLMPEGRDVLEALARPLPLRPDVFVIGAGREEESAQNAIDHAVTRLVAQLRRGVVSKAYLDSRASDDAAARMKPWDAGRYDAAPMHARRSYKQTRNVGKLLADAGACHARFAAIVERADDAAALAGVCTLKNLDSGEQWIDVLLGEVASRATVLSGR